MRRGLAMFVLALATAAWAGADAPAARTPRPAIAPAKAGTQCVAPPAQMRREHMSVLEHQRDETVRGGIRGARASLKACVECHASPDTRSVATAPGDFCVNCHSYAAVKVDCFQCHASMPAAGATAFHAPPGPDHHSPLALQLRAQLKKGFAR
jgi:hypothetical protein